MALGRKTGGRVKGTPNKASVEAQQRVASSGLTPLQFMVDLLQNPESKLEDKKWAASAAAPYLHPKLVASELKVSGHVITEIQNKIIDHGSNT